MVRIPTSKNLSITSRDYIILKRFYAGRMHVPSLDAVRDEDVMLALTLDKRDDGFVPHHIRACYGMSNAEWRAVAKELRVEGIRQRPYSHRYAWEKVSTPRGWSEVEAGAEVMS